MKYQVHLFVVLTSESKYTDNDLVEIFVLKSKVLTEIALENVLAAKKYLKRLQLTRITGEYTRFLPSNRPAVH